MNQADFLSIYLRLLAEKAEDNLLGRDIEHKFCEQLAASRNAIEQAGVPLSCATPWRSEAPNRLARPTPYS